MKKRRHPYYPFVPSLGRKQFDPSRALVSQVRLDQVEKSIPEGRLHMATERSIEITEVRVSLRNHPKVRAFVRITLYNALVIRGLKVIDGRSGLFVAMPSRKKPDGQYQDLAHPITRPGREYLTAKVLEAYQRELKNPSCSSARPDAVETVLDATAADLKQQGFGSFTETAGSFDRLKEEKQKPWG